VDELWLATYVGETPPSGAIGEPFLEEARLAAALPDTSAPSTRLEPSGPWHFERRAAR
jgi:hypothetical protein